MNNTTLVLVPLFEDRRDMCGTQYPKHGSVNCQNFSNDDCILRGLFGYQFDKISSKIFNWSQCFAAVKVSNVTMLLDESLGAIKFCNAYVLCTGTKVFCLERLKKESPDGTTIFYK